MDEEIPEILVDEVEMALKYMKNGNIEGKEGIVTELVKKEKKIILRNTIGK